MCCSCGRCGHGVFVTRDFKNLLILAAPLLFHSTFWFLTVPEPKYFALAAWLFAISPALAFMNREAACWLCCECGKSLPECTADILFVVGVPLFVGETRSSTAAAKDR